MASLNYPDKPWTDGDQFIDNNVQYTYVDDGINPGYWQGVSGGTAGYILPIASDTVLGGIKVGDNLTIAGDGKLSALADGTTSTLQEVTDAGNTTDNTIQVGGDPNDGANNGAKLVPQGMVMAGRPTADATSLVWGGFLQGTTPPTSSITADGSATFGGTAGAAKTETLKDGRILLTPADNYGLAIYHPNSDTGANKKLELNYDGSANFLGQVNVDRTGGFGAFAVSLNGTTNGTWYASGQLEIGGTIGSDPNIKLESTGAASFAGDEVSIDQFGTANFAQGDTKILRKSQGGYLNVHGDGQNTNKSAQVLDGSIKLRNDSGGSTIFQVRSGGNQFEDIGWSFNADGTTYIGAGTDGARPGGTPQIELNASGSARFGADNIRLNADGSAQFKDVVSGVTPQLADHLTTKSYVDAAIAAGGGGGGGGAADLQTVTDLGNFTTNSIEIGNTSSDPFITLGSNGAVRLNNTGFNQLDLQTERTGDNNNIGGLRFLNTDGTPQSAVYGYIGGRLGLLTDSKERVYINETGNVLIGGTLPALPNTTLFADGKVYAQKPGDFVCYLGTGTGTGSNFAVGDYTGNDGGISVNTRIYGDGRGDFGSRITIQRTDDDDFTALSVNNLAGTTVFRVNSNGDVGVGGALSGGGGKTFNPNVRLNTDGNAIFGGDAEGGANAGVKLAPNGRISVARTASGSPVFSGYTAGNNTITSTINADGSATFATGKLTLANSGAVVIERSNSGVCFRSGLDGETPTCEILSSGNASFTGAVQCGGNADNGSQSGTELKAGGRIVVSSANGTDTIFQGHTTGNSTPTITINANGRIESLFDGKFKLGVGESGASGSTNSFGQVAHTFNGFDGYTVYNDPDGNETVRITCTDGSASFAGVVDIGEWAGNSDSEGIRLYHDGPAYLQAKSTTNADTDLLQLRHGSEITSQIKANGNATFAGTINNGYDGASTTSSGCHIESGGVIYAQRPAGSTFSVWGGWQGTTRTSTIGADGSANFSGNVEVAGTGSQGSFQSVPTAGNGGYKAFRAKSASAGVSTQYYLYCEDKDGNGQVTISTDGTANFANSVRVGDALGSGEGTAVYHNKTYIRQDTGTDPAFRVYSGSYGVGQEKVEIRGDGSATFLGKITGAPSDLGTAIDVASNVAASASDATIIAQNKVDGGNVFIGKNNTANTTVIQSNGTAQFTNLTDGTTTKTMTEVLAGGGAGSVKVLAVFNSDGSELMAIGCSVARTTAGQYTITFNSAQPNTNYAAFATPSGNGFVGCNIKNRLTTSVEVHTHAGNTTPQDLSGPTSFMLIS